MFAQLLFAELQVGVAGQRGVLGQAAPIAAVHAAANRRLKAFLTPA
jgi:hypothetical protein